jgi:phosphoenolpyruvate carboxykinase (GTP)
MDWHGLEEFTKDDFENIMLIEREPWKKELLGHSELFEQAYDKIPKEFLFMRELLLSALWRSPEKIQLAPERTEDH